MQGGGLGVPSTTERHPEETELLHRRIREGCALLLASIALFAFADLALDAERRLAAYAVKVIQACMVLAALWTLRSRPTSRRAIATALLVVHGICVTTAVSGVMTRDVGTAPLLLIVLTMATATLLPWGAGPQAATAAVAALAVLGNVLLVSGTLGAERYAAVATLVALVASVYVARELERYRLGWWRAVEGARASEARKGAILEAALDAIVTLDHEGRVIEFNPAAERVFGYARADVLGKLLVELNVPRDLLERHGRGMQRFLAALDAPLLGQRMEVTAPRADGTEVPIEVAVTRVVQNGQPLFTAFARDIGERKRAEEALTMQARVLESMGEAVLVAGDDGVIVLTNPAHCAMFGYERGELVGQHFSRLIASPPEDGPPAFPEIAEKVLAGAVWGGEFGNRRKDGTAFTSYGRVSAAEIAGKRYWVCVQKDITERKRAEAAIVEWKNRYEAAVLASGSILYDHDPGTGEVTYGGAYESILGYRAEELAGGFARWCELVHPDDRKAFEAEVARHVETRAPCHAEYRVRRKDGSYVLVHADGHVIPDGRGEIGRMIGFIADVSAQRQVQEERDRFFNLSKDMLIILGFDGRVRRASPAVTQTLGYTAEEFGAEPALGFVHPDDRKATQAALRALAAGAAINSFRNRCRRKDGSYRWLEWNSTPLVEQKLVYSVARDITERMEGDVEKERAREAADAANRAKGEFLANMSHEIRTPMTAILGYTDLLYEPELPSTERTEYLDTIRQNGEHLLAIINDILDLSKIEAGKMTVERIACSPVALTGEVAALMRGRAQHKGLGFEVVHEGALPESVQVDPTRLRQILLNLVGNAIKFTQAGGVRLAVGLVAGDGAARTRLRFEVRDTGIGIPAEAQARLFQPFAQADTSTTRRFGGSGLGLMITRRLVEMLGGTIAVRSTPGQGSTFTVTIDPGPLDGVRLLAAATADEPPVAKPAAAAAELPALGCRVLLAEDGPDNQRLISFYLSRAGAEVAVAENGQVACEMVWDAEAAGRPFAVVLMDMQMPVLDGYDAAAALRRGGFRQPIVALTAHAMEGDRAKCLAAGCDDFLSKPMSRLALLETVHRHALRAAQGEAASPASASP